MLQVNNISFRYSTDKKVVEHISFQIDAGEHLCVMGESGSGKSTLLKLIYGLLDTDKGSIFWKGIKVVGPTHQLVPGMEFFKYVAQDFDLMPYISVEENIKKFLSRFYPEEAQQRTEKLLEVIEMKAFAKEKVKNLSGGQQQRVAIARALAKEPELILLDEPFSQIDNFKKNSLRRRLFSYLKEKNITCIVATHASEEALSFADKMLVIQNHQLIAFNTPTKLYQNPKKPYIASLFDDINDVLVDGGQKLLYPHQIKIVTHSEYQAVVKKSYYKGFYWLIEATYNQQKIYVQNKIDIPVNTKVYLMFKYDC